VRAGRQVFAGAVIASFAVAASAQQSYAPAAEKIARQAMASHFKLDQRKIRVDALDITGRSAVAYTSSGDSTCMFKLAQKQDKHWSIVKQSCERSSPTDIAISMVTQLTGASPGQVHADVLKYIGSSAIVQTQSQQQSCLLKMGRTPKPVNGWVVEKARCKRSDPAQTTIADSAS